MGSCEYSMADNNPCGRPLYEATDNDKPLCVMHAESETKLNESAVDFWAEVVSIMQGSSKWHRLQDALDFSGFVFRQPFYLTPSGRKKVIFENAKFFAESWFGGLDSEFSGATFDYAQFRQPASFAGAKFHGPVSFISVTFLKSADFARCEFFSHSEFILAKFRDVSFEGAHFGLHTSFRKAEFTGHCSFRRASFVDRSAKAFTLAGSVDFSDCDFQKDKLLIFDHINDGKEPFEVRFRNCNIEHASFRNIEWDREDGRIFLQDEKDLDEKNSDQHEVVAILYRQLLLNFQRVRAYQLAEECFIAEMDVSSRNHRLSLLHRFIIKLYGLLSVYGSSYTRALSWLIGLLLLFALIFAACGVKARPADPSSSMSSASQWTAQWSSREPLREMAKTFAAGFWTSLGVATFSHNAPVEPATRVGQNLATIESVVIPSQLALLLLALRRRFKR